MSAAPHGEARAREQIVATCVRLYDKGLIAGGEGNVSVRIGSTRILITPAGVPKADLRPADLVVVDESGQVVHATGRPSTELAMHLRIYRNRKDIHAVVHAHPPVATGFAIAGDAFAEPVLPEVIVALGEIAVVPYETPATEALAAAFEPLLDGHDVFLLANHGATTLGPTVEVAYARMESLEHSARILLAARLIGRVRTLTAQQVRDLVAAREGAEHRGRRGVAPPPTTGWRPNESDR